MMKINNDLDIPPTRRAYKATPLDINSLAFQKVKKNPQRGRASKKNKQTIKETRIIEI
jgi:hypothetical protein